MSAARLVWADFKSFVDGRALIIHERPLDDGNYLLEAHDGPVVRYCKLRNEDADYTTYVNDYQGKANKPVGAASVGGIKEPNNYRARLQGMGCWTITAGQTVDCDYQMEQLAWLGTNKKAYFDGVQYYAKDATLGDSVQFQVVDKDGLVYPAGTVLEEFGDNWFVGPNILEDIRLFKSLIYPGFYIRVKYTSTGGTDVKFMCNMFRFVKTNEDA